MNDRRVPSVCAKIARADEHLKALDTATGEWCQRDPQPVRIDRECNADGRVHIFRFRVIDPPDVQLWGTLLGDALHNLRCALDHMVYALAIAHTGQDPPPSDASLMFPICSGEGWFKSKRVQGRIAGLDECTRAAVERMQPYNRLKPGKWFMPLWWLAQLNDIDKHRLGHIAPAAAHYDDVVVDPNVTIVSAVWNEGHLVDRTPLFKLVIAEPKPRVYVDLNCTASIVLRVGKIRPVSLLWTAKHIRDEVAIVCRYLALFFPRGYEPGSAGEVSFDPGTGHTPPPDRDRALP